MLSPATPSLPQMLNVVFQRMEAGSTHVVVPPIVVSDVLGLPPADASNMSAFVQQFLADVIASVDPFGMVAQEIQQVSWCGRGTPANGCKWMSDAVCVACTFLCCGCIKHADFGLTCPPLPCSLQGLDDAFVAQTPIMEAYAEDLYDPSDPTDRQQIEWRQRQAAAATSSSAAAAEGEAEEGSSVAGAAEGGSVQRGGSGVPASLGGEGQPSPGPSSHAGEGFGGAGYAPSGTSDLTSGHAALEAASKQLSMPAQLQKDAFLVFRALCKLSIRSTEAAPGSEVTTIRGKVRQAGACSHAEISAAAAAGVQRLAASLSICLPNQCLVGVPARCQSSHDACYPPLPMPLLTTGAGPGAAEDPAGEQRAAVPHRRALC